jgi:hypothetical protein
MEKNQSRCEVEIDRAALREVTTLSAKADSFSEWQAQICHNFHTYHLGYYSDVDSAISAYEAALARIDATGRMS